MRLTVYPLEGRSARTDEQRPRRQGRLKMLLVLLVCAAPVAASYLMYFVVRPEGRSNYGTLVVPTRPMPAVALHALDGSERPSFGLKGQWLLVVVAPSACPAGCERLLYAQRQLREMLGRERERIEKVWLVSDGGRVPDVIQASVGLASAVTVLRFPVAELGRWLQAAPGRALDEHLYLVDPMGEWMMRFPADFDPAKVKRDLDRVLRASSSWDRPGR